MSVSSKESPDPNLPRIWIQPHYASFNGLRGVAILLVFLMHFGNYLIPQQITKYMWVGVDLFFVLSGFLITGILYDSLQDPLFFRNFYMRRSLRIFPVFYGFFLVLFLLTPLLHLSYDNLLLTYFFYIGNLTIPFIDLAHRNPTIITCIFDSHIVHVNIGHLWSLCVEEQFYLVWPAVVWLARSRLRLMRIYVLLCTAILFGRICVQIHHFHYLFEKPLLLMWSTYTRADTLLVGAWFALWLRGRPLSTSQLHKLSSALFIIPAFIIVLVMAVLHRFVDRYGDPFIWTAGYTLIALIAAGVILRSLDDTSRLSRFLQNRYLVAFGSISYGFYFIHNLFTQAFRELAEKGMFGSNAAWIIPLLAFGISLLLATLSFRCFESPFLKLKSRLAPQWVSESVPMAVRDSSHDDIHVPAPLHISEPRP